MGEMEDFISSRAKGGVTPVHQGHPLPEGRRDTTGEKPS